MVQADHDSETQGLMGQMRCRDEHNYYTLVVGPYDARWLRSLGRAGLVVCD
jgi:hypothetical protein